MVAGRDDEHFPEIVGQLGLGAQIVDDLADVPMLRHRDQVALHQAAGGFLAIGERFLDRRAVVGLHRPQHRALLVLLEVLDDRDRVVGVELAGDLGDLLGRHFADQDLADVLVHFGEDVGVDESGQRGDQPLALVGAGQFDRSATSAG